MSGFDREKYEEDHVPVTERLQARIRLLEEQKRTLEEALWQAALVLRDIADSSPNWMQPDAVAENERWMRGRAREGWKAAEAAALAVREEGEKT